MRERRYVKFKVNMYEDTKSKIIDRRPERDIIHYCWSRVVLLAGKVNLEGDLYLSKNIPYTIETLAIEFNRSIEEVKLAVEVLMELEMLELTEEKIYRVKNFAKHQSIKVKDKITTTKKEDNIKGKDTTLDEKPKNEINDNIINNKDKEAENEVNINDVEDINGNERGGLKIINNDINKIENDSPSDKHNKDSSGKISSDLEIKTNRKRRKQKKKDVDFDFTDEIGENEEICGFTDGDGARILGEGEKVIFEMAF